jgi:hypothetical protein
MGIKTYEKINWGHVGDVTHIAHMLREVVIACDLEFEDEVDKRGI